MAGPWEQYQKPTSGPWDKYGRAERIATLKAKNPAEYDSASPEFQAKYGAEPVNPAIQVIGRTARIGAQAVAGLPLLAADAGVAARNLMQPKTQQTLSGLITGQQPQQDQYELPSQTFRTALDQLIPAPQDFGGKATEVVGSAIAGARYFPNVGAARQAPSNYRPADPFQVPPVPEEAIPAAAPSQAAVPARSAGSFGPVGADSSKGLSQAQKEVAERVKKLGMRLTPGQATGSRSLQQLEAKIESQPFSSGPINALKAKNADVVNRSFLQAIGEKGKEVTEAVIRNADDRIGRAFEVAASRNKVIYDDALQSGLAEIEGNVASEVGEAGIGVIRKQLAGILEKASVQGGSITGRQYQNIRMALSRVSNSQDPAVGYWARQIREQLDEALLRSVGPDDAARLANARSQYRVLITAMNSNAVNTAKGSVSPGLLTNAFSRADKKGFIEGLNQSNLYNSLRFYKAFPSVVGDSGTATRMPFQGLTDLALRVPANVATRAYLSRPSMAAATGSQNALNRLGGLGQTTTPYSPQFVNSLLTQFGR